MEPFPDDTQQQLYDLLAGVETDRAPEPVELLEAA